jgi:hypothetical protein
MKNMKLATKMAMGFGALIAISIILGGIAVYYMNGVKDESTLIANEYVPEVDIANNLERFSLLTMYDMRGYGLTGRDDFLKSGQANLVQVNTFLDEALTLSENSTALVKLKDEANDVKVAVAEYEKLVEETVASNREMDAAKNQMDVSAGNYMSNCSEFLIGQNEKMRREIASGVGVAGLNERLQKITLINDIIDLGNAARVQNFKAQADDDAQQLMDALTLFPKIDAKIAEISQITYEAADKEALANIQTAADNYEEAMTTAQEEMTQLQSLAAQRDATGELVLTKSKGVALAGVENTQEIADNAMNALSAASRILIWGLLFAAGLGVGVAFWMTRSITKPLQRIIDVLSGGAEQVTSAASQVSQSSQELAEGASEQAASIEETSSSLEEMASMTRQNAEGAKQANTLAGETQDAAEEGNDKMEQMLQAINDVNESADETSKIIKTIDEIAFQTNLLALNAAVEAARAGEAGQGFAVVADEVRSLAQRAAEAAKTTAELIEGSKANTERSVSIVEEVAKSLGDMNEKAKKVNELVGEINAASQEQDQGISQINVAITQVDQVTQRVAANAEESASASEEMTAQAELLMESVIELLSMVQGKKEGAAHLQRSGGKKKKKQEPAKPQNGNGSQHHEFHSQPNESPAPKKQQAAATTNGQHEDEIDPESVIPLDDGDDF